MSRKRLRLEGNSVEEVLAKVQAQFGATAHVVEAEKVRSGGIGGFFAREYVAVTVDVPEELAVLDSVAHRPAAAHSVNAGGTGNGGGAGSFSTSIVETHARPAPGSSAGGPPAGGIEAMLAAADASDGFVSGPAPVTHSAQTANPKPKGSRPAAQPAELDARFANLSSGETVTDARFETFEAADPPSYPGASPRREETQVEADDLFAQTLKTESASALRDFEILMPHEVPKAERTVEPMVWPTAARVEPSPREKDFDDILRSAKALVQEPTPSDAPELAPPVAGETFDVRTSGATIAELLEIGVPADLLGHLPLGRGQHALSSVLNHVLKAPQLWPDAGSIVVALGTGTSALPTARIVANKVGVLERDIVGAGTFSAERNTDRTVLTAQAARTLRRSAREDQESVVVFLDIGPAQTDAYLAGRLLDALDPDYIVAAIRADHDIAHTARTIADVTQGRGLHWLAAEGVIGSLAPARVLSLSVPVAYIDTLEANPVVWAAAISQALPSITWD